MGQATDNIHGPKDPGHIKGKFTVSIGITLQYTANYFSADIKRHDAKLLSEVRTFEPVALKVVPQKKKNLQHVSVNANSCVAYIHTSCDFSDEPWSYYIRK